jgi:flavin-dependent dehydrogenase
VPGLLLIGDAAGVVSPFNGEGISYAMETGEIAAELAHDALVSGRMGRAMLYPTVLREAFGSYFTMGRLFAKAIGDPRIMQASTRLLLPNEAVMRFAMRVLANLTDGKDGDAQDRLFAFVERLAPAS